MICDVMLIALLVVHVLASVCDPAPLPDDDGPRDTCQHTVWDNRRETGVQVVYAGCAEGQVNWHYPYGAVRIILQPDRSDRKFTACFIAHSKHTLTKISLELNHENSLGNSDKPQDNKHSNVRHDSGEMTGVYHNKEFHDGKDLQYAYFSEKLMVDYHDDSNSVDIVHGSPGKNKVHDLGFLQTLKLLNSTHPSMVREICIPSTGDPVSLYLEVHRDVSMTTMGLVTIDYDLHHDTQQYASDDMEECQPCSDAEILQKVCTSDFVVQGSVGPIYHHDDAGDTEIRVTTSRVIRQRMQLFQPADAVVQSNSTSMNRHAGSVFFPRKCNVRHSSGQFLFVGRVRLGRALLSCAIRLRDFEKMWTRAEEQAQTWCRLD